MKESQVSQLQKTKGKVPKYSDKFKDLLGKIQKNGKEVQKTQAEPVEKYEHIKIDNEYQFVTQPQKQFFFFRVKSIGVGAHSFVYLTQQQQTKCLYAQKAINKSHAKKHIQELKNQIKIQYQLQHDNLISLYHFYSDTSYVYLIMEYAEESLYNLKAKFKIFKEKEVIEILRQLLHGIQYMHSHGYIHADIKIQNIMIRNGRIKLCDFGYASRFTKERHIESDEIIGTLQYLSPQYVQGVDSGTMRDVWAIGILCYELWTGKNPFQELKQNQKWMKLVKPNYDQFLQQLGRIEVEQQRKSQKVQMIIKHTLCPTAERYSVQKLLNFQCFNVST